MPSDTTFDPTYLPRPTVTVTPATPAYPAEGGTLDLLVEVSVAFPGTAIDRKPLNVALVVDRSGSMGGAPLAGAKLGAEVAVGMLMPGDWVSVVAYDDHVTVVVPCTPVDGDRRAIVGAIRGIAVGGSTALHAGWAEGVTQALACPVADAVHRVVLLTDGLANCGVTHAADIARDVRDAVAHGVTTSAYGLGRSYDELLLRAVADAGNGNYAFIEDPRQIAELFGQELAGLSALRGTGLRLRAHGATLEPVGVGLGADERGVVLPDLSAGLSLEVLMRANVPRGGAAPTLVLEWDDTLTSRRERLEATVAAEARPAAEVARMPVDPRVQDMRELFELAFEKARVADAARQGDREGARKSLRYAKQRLLNLVDPAARAAESAELDAIDARLQDDLVMSAKFVLQGSHDRMRSRGVDKRRALAEAEARHREAKLAAMAAAGAPGSNGTVCERRLPHAAGGFTTVQVARGDITAEGVDAIVNSSNRGLFGTHGVDGAIHRRGGPELTAATRALGTIDHGAAVFTPGFGLPATYVIHTATTPWGTTGKEAETLRRCYASVFTVAERLGARSLAIPAIGTGSYGYPAAEAAEVAVGSLVQWLATRGRADLVRFVVNDRGIAAAYRRALEAAT